MAIRQHYNSELQKISQSVVKMGLSVNHYFKQTLRALKEGDKKNASLLIEEDESINKMETEIEDRSILLIAKEQPVAGDLRKIIVALKIINQLERMGDHCAHICKTIETIDFNRDIGNEMEQISTMADIAYSNLERILTAYLNVDEKEAMQIAEEDKKIDTIHRNLMKELPAKMESGSGQINEALNLIFISRYIERFGDHILNICEAVVYDATGNHVEY